MVERFVFAQRCDSPCESHAMPRISLLIFRTLSPSFPRPPEATIDMPTGVGLGQSCALVAFLLLHASSFYTATAVVAPPPPPPLPPVGDVAAAYALLERVLPGASPSFAFSLDASCPGVGRCFTLSDAPAGVAIAASSVSELTAGLGVYLREYCNMTLGWPRGGASNVFMPAAWPRVDARVTQSRATPFSYMQNVCTHSYSLVWYSWQQWSAFIDWAALSGYNLVLSMTGQEEVAWKVFSQFNVSDGDIRTWFNGPAFLTWSRGQNEYGNNIAGPLPRSWMKGQWALQKQILARQRGLGIVGQLPGFQANVPWVLAAIQTDKNITQQGDTGWLNSVDPLFSTIADVWMTNLCADFGCEDQWFQMDGYFDGGTAGWRVQGLGSDVSAAVSVLRATPPALSLPACTWSAALPNTYVAGCASGCASSSTLLAAQAACLAAVDDCGGITSGSAGHYELRAANSGSPSDSGETSWLITNGAACRPPPGPILPDAVWRERGAAAYAGLARTVPGAVWSFQGWAIIDWTTRDQASALSGFVDAVPPGKFVIIDMSVDGSGEWKKWNNAGFFGAPFLWTTLHGELVASQPDRKDSHPATPHVQDFSFTHPLTSVILVSVLPIILIQILAALMA